MSGGETPLHWAAATCNVDKLKQLLASCSKEDVNTTTNNGWTPLHVAARSGYTPIIQVLLEDGRIDPLVKNADGQTALHMASDCNHSASAKCLIEHGSSDDGERARALARMEHEQQVRRQNDKRLGFDTGRRLEREQIEEERSAQARDAASASPTTAAEARPKSHEKGRSPLERRAASRSSDALQPSPAAVSAAAGTRASPSPRATPSPKVARQRSRRRCRVGPSEEGEGEEGEGDGDDRPISSTWERVVSSTHDPANRFYPPASPSRQSPAANGQSPTPTRGGGGDGVSEWDVARKE